MKIAIKEVGKELRLVETDEMYRSDCVKEFIGKKATPQFVRMAEDGTFCMGLNEDGLLLDLPVNFLFETSSKEWPIQKAVGTVVFVRTKPVNIFAEKIYDYEVVDITYDDYAHINRMLSPYYQDYLKANFKDYGRGGFVIKPL